MWAVCFDSEEASFCLVWCPVELLVELHVLQQRQHLLCLSGWLATLGRRLAFDQHILHRLQLEMPLLELCLRPESRALAWRQVIHSLHHVKALGYFFWWRCYTRHVIFVVHNYLYTKRGADLVNRGVAELSQTDPRGYGGWCGVSRTSSFSDKF